MVRQSWTSIDFSFSLLSYAPVYIHMYIYLGKDEHGRSHYEYKRQ
jgi:hypothetical protein